jgi:hypothetical protein
MKILLILLLILSLGLKFVPSAMAQVTAHSAIVSWTASPSPTVTHYGIFRATVSGGPYTYVGYTPGLTFTDTKNLVEGTTYYYVVVAFTDVDPAVGHSYHSVNSNEGQGTISVSPVIAPATGLTVTTH